MAIKAATKGVSPSAYYDQKTTLDRGRPDKSFGPALGTRNLYIDAMTRALAGSSPVTPYSPQVLARLGMSKMVGPSEAGTQVDLSPLAERLALLQTQNERNRYLAALGQGYVQGGNLFAARKKIFNSWDTQKAPSSLFRAGQIAGGGIGAFIGGYFGGSSGADAMGKFGAWDVGNQTTAMGSGGGYIKDRQDQQMGSVV